MSQKKPPNLSKSSPNLNFFYETLGALNQACAQQYFLITTIQAFIKLQYNWMDNINTKSASLIGMTWEVLNSPCRFDSAAFSYSGGIRIQLISIFISPECLCVYYPLPFPIPNNSRCSRQSSGIGFRSLVTDSPSGSSPLMIAS